MTNYSRKILIAVRYSHRYFKHTEVLQSLGTNGMVIGSANLMRYGSHTITQRLVYNREDHWQPEHARRATRQLSFV